MQHEDDLRALAKIMEFGRAVSIFLLVVHVYVYCYPSITAWHLNLEVIDRILVNFNDTTGIFNCILWSKLLAVLLLAVSCLGTHGVKGEKITWPKIYAALVAGCALFFLNWWLLELPLPHMANTAFYIFTLTAGYLALLMSGLWMSRLYRHNLMEDVFNMENESFMQETRLMENEYSVNLPTRFYYKKRWNNGFVNIVNIFFKLFDLCFRNRKTQLHFCSCKSHPETSPGCKFLIGRKNILHFLTGISCAEGTFIAVCVTHKGINSFYLYY